MATPGTHTLVSLTPYSAAEMQQLTDGDRRTLRRASFHWPAPGSALIVPPPPDYSTPAAVTKRCREGGLWSPFAHQSFKRVGAWWEPDASFRTLYRAFRKVAPAVVCRVEDTHVSKWRVVRVVGQWSVQGAVTPGGYVTTPKPDG